MTRRIAIYPTDMTDAELDQAIERLKVMQKWDSDHPYAGVCGEDDARADYLRELVRERDARSLQKAGF